MLFGYQVWGSIDATLDLWGEICLLGNFWICVRGNKWLYYCRLGRAGSIGSGNCCCSYFTPSKSLWAWYRILFQGCNSDEEYKFMMEEVSKVLQHYKNASNHLQWKRSNSTFQIPGFFKLPFNFCWKLFLL